MLGHLAMCVKNVRHKKHQIENKKSIMITTEVMKLVSFY